MKKGKIISIVLAAVNVVLILACVALLLGMDREKPHFEFDAVDIIYQEGMDISLLLEGISAFDGKDGNVTDRIVVEKVTENRRNASAIVSYAVSDKAGNVAKCSREFAAVYIEDEESEKLAKGEEAQEEWLVQTGFWAELAGGEEENSEEEGEGNGDGDEGENADGEREGVGGERESAGGEREGVGGERESVGGEREGVGGERESAGREREGVGGEREDAGGEGESVGGEGEDAGGEEENAGREASEDRTGQRNRENAGREGEGADGEERDAQGNEREDARGRGEEAQTAAGNRNMDDAGAPVLSLKTSEVKTSVGVAPAWVEVIETLSDDKDNYETLFRNLNVSKYDINKAGTYQVSVFTQDSDGNKSPTVPLTITVR